MDEEAFMASLSDAVSEVGAAIWERAKITPHEKAIKQAVCSVADLLGNPEKRRTSYSAGKVSESFGTAGFDLTCTACIKRWLGGSGIFTRGRWL